MQDMTPDRARAFAAGAISNPRQWLAQALIHRLLVKARVPNALALAGITRIMRGGTSRARGRRPVDGTLARGQPLRDSPANWVSFINLRTSPVAVSTPCLRIRRLR